MSITPLLLLILLPVGVLPQLLSSLSIAPSDVLTRDKQWTKESIKTLWKERHSMDHTPLFKYRYPSQPHVDILFKNETASPTGSLKHRYTWMLMMWALLEGHVLEGTPVYEASSGNTAASLAYMCQKIGANFTAIVPDTIEQIKVDHIAEFGGGVHKVPIARRLIEAARIAKENNGFFMNQFGNADRAEEYHESGDYSLESANMFHEILSQMEADNNQIIKAPHFFVHSAGTGGTISSIGKYAKKYGKNTEIVLADTEYSVYFDYINSRRFINESGASLWIEPGMAGIGFGPMGKAVKGETTSLDPAVIDRTLKIPDLASTAAMKVLRGQGISGGTSSGVNFLSALHLAAVTQPLPSARLTITTILADPGHYYDTSYFNREWIADKFAAHGGLKVYDCWVSVIERSLIEPIDPLRVGAIDCDKNAV